MSQVGDDTAVQTEPLARQILERSLHVRRGENVVVESWTHTLPWALACIRAARRMGAHATLLYEDEATYWASVESSDPKVLGTLSEVEKAALSKTHAYVHFWGPADRPRLYDLPDKTRQALLAFNPTWYQVAEKAGVRGCRVGLGIVSPERAHRLERDFAEWRRQVIEASLVDPATLLAEGRKIGSRLERGRELHITHPNGTDLTLRLRRRKTVVEAGTLTPQLRKMGNLMVNLPAGVATVAVDESHGEGTFVANRGSWTMRDVYRGGTWELRGGRLVSYQYESGGAEFEAAYRKAPKGRDRVGLLSVGLNPAIHDLPNLEDAERGNLCLAVGGNADYGGTNRAPYLAWLTLAGATVTVDGVPLVEDGRPVA